MTLLTPELRGLISSGPLAHLTTINADGSPQVSVIWIGLDGDDVVSGHMGRHVKVRNAERDPRVVLSFDAPRVPGAFLAEYAVLHATATVTAGGALDLLTRLTKVYVNPGVDFPGPKGDGFILRYSIHRVGGVGPWAAAR
jgi:PPOX class probable F420-dependent enzyme